MYHTHKKKFLSFYERHKRMPGYQELMALTGFPSPAEEELLDVMDFDEYLTPNKESSYILRVKGDSMIDAGIQAGDMVIVERRNAKQGEIVIASIDGEYTIKYLRKKDGRFFLEPANKENKPIYPGEGFRVEAV